MSHIFKATSLINVLRRLPKHLTFSNYTLGIRNYADTSKSDSKTVLVKVHGTDSERLRVRLARPADVPRVLRFVRDHAHVWPGPLAPRNNLVLGDLVARSLAQGHSIIAEQHTQGHGLGARPRLLGLALGAAVCPWDADLLDRWAGCVRCRRSRRLLHFAAHCLRAPMLHDKYRIDNILQVVLIVPPDTPKSVEIVHVLAKHAVKHALDAGFPLLRFDATKDCVANCLEELTLKKEWSLSYQLLARTQVDDSDAEGLDCNSDGVEHYKDNSGKITVYSALINKYGGTSKHSGGRKPDVTYNNPVLKK